MLDDTKQSFLTSLTGHSESGLLRFAPAPTALGLSTHLYPFWVSAPSLNLLHQESAESIACDSVHNHSQVVHVEAFKLAQRPQHARSLLGTNCIHAAQRKLSAVLAHDVS